jgi:hypothetical protein
MSSSQMRRHVALVREVVSEKVIVSIIRLEIISELETKLAVTSNCILQLLISANIDLGCRFLSP